MKTGVAVTILILLLPLAGCRSRAAEATAVLDVDRIVESPEACSGGCRVAGVVSHVGDDLVLLISEKEFEECGVECPPWQLPVEWSGESPEVGDRVEVAGELVEREDGRVFRAHEVRQTGGGD